MALHIWKTLRGLKRFNWIIALAWASLSVNAKVLISFVKSFVALASHHICGRLVQTFQTIHAIRRYGVQAWTLLHVGCHGSRTRTLRIPCKISLTIAYISSSGLICCPCALLGEFWVDRGRYARVFVPETIHPLPCAPPSVRLILDQRT